MKGLAQHHWRALIAWIIVAGLIGGVSAAALTINQHLKAEHSASLKLLTDKTRRMQSLVNQAPELETLMAQMDQTLSTSGIFVDAPSRQQGFAIIQSHVDDVVSSNGGRLERVSAGKDDADRSGSITLSVEYRAEATSALEILAELEHGRPMLLQKGVAMNAVRAPGNGSDAPEIELRITAEFTAYLKEGER
ncbi:MAG: type II secretion system protein GspM [Paracoccaceae bacterium]